MIALAAAAVGTPPSLSHARGAAEIAVEDEIAGQIDAEVQDVLELPAPWVSVEAADGKTYFHNTEVRRGKWGAQ